MSILQPLELLCHPSSPCAAVRKIEVRVRRKPGALALGFRLTGDLTQVRVPAPCAPRLATQLWVHTCFEAFVAIDGTNGYHEFNFAPSGEWAAYAFRSYRNGGLVADQALAAEALAPAIAARHTDAHLEVDATVPLAPLSSRHARAVLRLGLSAVVESTGGSLSYWALRHPAGKPDFHQRDAWVLRLEPPRRE